MTLSPGARVELTPEAKTQLKAQYGAYQTVDGVGVVVENPFAEVFPRVLVEEASRELGYGDVWVRWEFDPDTPTPMTAAELTEWKPSGEASTTGRFAVGDVVQTRQDFCECTRCDFTFGVVIRLTPTGVTLGGTTDHDYTVQWDDGLITYDYDGELCAAGERFDNKED